MFKKALVIPLATMLILFAGAAIAGDGQIIVLDPEEVASNYMDLDEVPLGLQIQVNLDNYNCMFIDLEEIELQAPVFIDLTASAPTEESHASLL